MAFDFKKEYKEFYLPKGKPEIVTVLGAVKLKTKNSFSTMLLHGVMNLFWR